MALRAAVIRCFLLLLQIVMSALCAPRHAAFGGNAASGSGTIAQAQAACV
jgi:hypothetical protein